MTPLLDLFDESGQGSARGVMVLANSGNATVIVS